MDTVHSFWIEGELTENQLLTITSFLRHGHPFVLYAYERPARLPEQVTVRDLNPFVPNSEVFHYRHMDHDHRLGGICERIKSELIYQVGGWHVDLDVTCLRPFEFTSEYVLRPHCRTVVANIIKCPPQCELARLYRDDARTLDAENRDWERSFAGLAAAVRALGLESFIVGEQIFGRDDGDWPLFLRTDGGAPAADRYAIHWCGSMGSFRRVEPGSFYARLLSDYGLA